MMHFRFLRRRWTIAESRLAYFEAPKMDLPPLDVKKDAGKEGADKKPLDGKDVKEGGPKNKAEEERAKIEKAMNETVKKVQELATRLYNARVESGSKGIDPKDTAKLDAMKQAAGNDVAAVLRAMPNIPRWLKIDAGKPPVVGINPDAMKPAAPDAAPVKPVEAKDSSTEGTYLESVKKDISSSYENMTRADSGWKALGYALQILQKALEALPLIVNGSLLDKRPEVVEKQKNRQRLLKEVTKDGTNDIGNKIDALKTKKATEKAGLEDQVKKGSEQLPKLKTERETAEKTYNDLIAKGEKPDGDAAKNAKAVLDKAVAAEKALTDVIATATSNIKTLTADITALEEMAKDLKKTLETVNVAIMQAEAANPNFAKAFGKFTVTPDGIVPDGKDGQLAKWFPNASFDKPITVAQFIAKINELNPSKPAAAPAPKPGPEKEPTAPALLASPDGERNLRLALSGGEDPTVSGGINGLLTEDVSVNQLRSPALAPRKTELLKTLAGLKDVKSADGNPKYSATTLDAATKLTAQLNEPYKPDEAAEMSAKIRGNINGIIVKFRNDPETTKAIKDIADDPKAIAALKTPAYKEPLNTLKNALALIIPDKSKYSQPLRDAATGLAAKLK